MENEFPKRKSPRLQGFDYNREGIYFITICTKDRRCILSRIVVTGVPDCPQIDLTNYGKFAEKYIKQLNEFYNHISIESYVIMPNHIHILLFVKEDGQSRTPVPTTRANTVISQFISTFKRFCNKEYGENIWQSRFNDHIIRNRDDYEKHLRYIFENPMCWYYDEFYIEE